MAKKSQRKRALSQPYQRRGATFAVPLADGQFGACRVLRVRPEAEISLLAATPYVGPQPPALSDPRLRTILVMDGLDFDHWPCVLWQYWVEPPPKGFRYLGLVEPSPAEERMNPDAYNKFWYYYGKYIWQEWRWLHDREALIAEYEKEFGPGSVRQVLREKKRQAEMTLEKLRKERFFADWEGHVAPEIVRQSRKIVRDTI